MEQIPGILALMIPVIIFMIPIVAILTAHQRKMAEILQQGQAAANREEVRALQNTIQELKQIVHEQAIAQDNVLQRLERLEPSKNGALEKRLKGVS